MARFNAIRRERPQKRHIARCSMLVTASPSVTAYEHCVCLRLCVQSSSLVARTMRSAMHSRQQQQQQQQQQPRKARRRYNEQRHQAATFSISRNRRRTPAAAVKRETQLASGRSWALDRRRRRHWPPADIKHSTRTIGYTPPLRQLSTH